MGNSQSTSSTPKHSTPPEAETNGDHAVYCPDTTATTESTQTPEGNEEGGASQLITKRRSLMKFPSLRRKSRGFAGVNEDAIVDSPSPSRRRWRAFSGLKSRPVSTIADSSATATDGQPCEDATDVSADRGVNGKGKGRESEVAPQTLLSADESVTRTFEPSVDVSGPSLTTAEDHETAPSPTTVLRELRELQDTLSIANDAQGNILGSPQAEPESGTGDQGERPPTPMPASVLDATPEPRDGARLGSGSNPALAETLGSWMSGRVRSENVESASDSAPVASSSPPAAGSSAPYRPFSNISPDIDNSADSLGPFARYPPRPTNAFGMSTSGAPPIPPAPHSMLGQSEVPRPGQADRRTLPPAGTGTLVVVQGVVHTTDVRHAHPPPPRATDPSQQFPRSTSSTPTLRTSSHSPASATSSRAPTPQPSPRRGRFSSLTSGLRPRSRPRTSPSLRSAGMGGWRHSLAGPGYDPSTSETTSDHSVSLGQDLGSSASDAETMSTSMSSSAGASARSDAPHADSLHNDQTVRGDTTTPHESQGQFDGRGPGRARVDTGGQARERDAEGVSEDEGEAELSASSIEVLGTLLSVATAATAASLVTGTTDPLFSSGLAGPPGPTSNTASGGSPTGPRDGLNTGVPSISPGPPRSPPSQGVGVDGNNHEAVNTRMRAAWESLRDRFSRPRGRRGAGAAENESREDPREQMLREMARAFNMGLGLDPESDHDELWEQERRGDGSQTESSEEVAHGGATMPEVPLSNESTLQEHVTRVAPGSGGSGPGPEGSFERFLHNLQVDLRTALTEDYAVRRARAQQARNARTGSQSVSILDGAPSPSSPVDTDTTPGSPPDSTVGHDSGERREENEALSRMHTTVAEPPSPPLVPTVPNTPRAATLDLPSLPGIADTRTREGPGFTPAPAQAQGITGQPGAGINWWRLYRFPPMQLAPHTGNTGISTAGIPAQPQGVPSEHSPVSSSTEPPAPLASSSSRSFSSSPPPPNAEAAPTQNVVPVIVVGLQSVPVNRAAAHHHHHHTPPPPFGSPSMTSPIPSADAPSDTLPRDRAWPLRAASRAFGRRSRRNDAEPPMDSTIPSQPENPSPGPLREGRPGGRTYLIFVIGGYYPPNHSIVTGADDMNSFEALWELAELLGQVKPPVASREDIEKSGLEVIKASSLSDYEKSGKVASNTIERCLICLDDYDSRDDLRLLSCRHIFHKQCVDKWLEQGRNNCPACRTKGVSTGDESPVRPVRDIQPDDPLGVLD